MGNKCDVIPITAGRRTAGVPSPLVSVRRVGSGIAIKIATGTRSNSIRGMPNLFGDTDYELAAQIAAGGTADQEDYDAVRYLIVKDDRIRVLPDGVPEPEDAELVFSSAEALHAGVAKWPLRRLVAIWNQLPEVKTIARFENRQVAAERIWRAIEGVRQTFARSSPP